MQVVAVVLTRVELLLLSSSTVIRPSWKLVWRVCCRLLSTPAPRHSRCHPCPKQAPAQQQQQQLRMTLVVVHCRHSALELVLELGLVQVQMLER